MLGDNFRYPNTGGCALQIKIAGDPENILHFKLYVNTVNPLYYDHVCSKLSLPLK